MNDVLVTQIEKLLSSDEWMQFHFSLLQKLNIEEAVLMSFLINWSYRTRAREHNNGWFYCHSKRIMDVFNIKRHKQQRLMRILDRKGFIKTKLLGMPAQRHININWQKIMDGLSVPPVRRKSSAQVSRKSSGDNVEVNTYKCSRESRLHNMHQSKPPSFEVVCCDLLKKTILSCRASIRRNFVTSKWQTAKQAPILKQIIKQYKDQEEFLDVFEWYLSHLNEAENNNLPTCVSPKRLKSCWGWIEERYKKESHKDKMLEVTKQAKDICETLRMQHWPKGSKEHLEQAVQLSLDNYSAFCQRLKKHVKKAKDSKFQQASIHFMEHALTRLPEATNFILNWFRKLNKQVQTWDNWKGDLRDQAFKPNKENKDFLNLGRSFARDWSGRESDWDTLMEQLDESAEIR